MLLYVHVLWVTCMLLFILWNIYPVEIDQPRNFSATVVKHISPDSHFIMHQGHIVPLTDHTSCKFLQFLSKDDSNRV